MTVRALFTLQTIPAALIVAVRTQHRELLSEIRKEKLQKRQDDLQKEQGDFSEKQPSPQKVSENLPKDWRKLRPILSYEQVVGIARLDANGVKEFSRRYDVDERTVTNWRIYANKEVTSGGRQ